VEVDVLVVCVFRHQISHFGVQLHTQTNQNTKYNVYMLRRVYQRICDHIFNYSTLH